MKTNPLVISTAMILGHCVRVHDHPARGRGYFVNFVGVACGPYPTRGTAERAILKAVRHSVYKRRRERRRPASSPSAPSEV
jgi:hypothetical protein